MKKLIIATCAISGFMMFASCAKSPSKGDMPYNKGINVIPAPVSLEQGEGNFKVGKSMRIYAATEPVKAVASFFAAKLNTATGYAISVAEGEGKDGVSLIIDESLDLKDEGYTLDVASKAVSVKAKTPQGLFYGMQTFLQLLPAEIESPEVVGDMAWTAPCVAVRDEPRFGYRGVMLDPCRHFIPVENVKKQLDVFALFKINTLHWHLSDDQGWRIEIKKYPKLTEIGSKRIEGEGFEYGGFYTQEQIKEVVQYAADRFITVIPEIELPGHEMAAISAYPELSCTGEPATPRIIWGVEDVVLCAGKESTFEFFENVMNEVVPLFPGEYFHIGGDECPKSSWKKCPLCQKRIKEEGLKASGGHSAEERLQSYFVERMEKVMAKLGKKIIGWDEILEGGLAPSATVMSWRGLQGGITAANMGHDVIMTPGSEGMYLDQYAGDYKIEPVGIGGFDPVVKVYGYNPVPDTLVATGKDNYIKGVQCNNWSEYMYDTDLMEYRMYPSLLAVSEIAWTSLARKDYKDFERRLDNALVRLDGHKITYHIPQPEQPHGSCNFVAFTDKTSLEFTSVRPVKMVYTLNDSEPTAESAIYTDPIEFTESGVIKIRSVLPSGKMSVTRTILVQKQALAPAKDVKSVLPGLKMMLTDGMFLESSKLAGVKNWKESEIKELDEILARPVPNDGSMRGVNQYASVATGYLDIPEDGVYFVSSDNEEVWIDGKLLVNNGGEVKRFSRHDSSVALAKGLHEFKVVFLGHIIGGWPSNWNDGGVRLRKSDAENFVPVSGNMLFH